MSSTYYLEKADTKEEFAKIFEDVENKANEFDQLVMNITFNNQSHKLILDSSKLKLNLLKKKRKVI